MSGYIIIGVDPGLSGHVAVLFPDRKEDYPISDFTLTIKGARKRSPVTGEMRDREISEYDRPAIARRIWRLRAEAREKGLEIRGYIEKYIPRPKMIRDPKTGQMIEIKEGKAATAKQARGYEVWIMAAAMAGIPMEEVTAQTWKKKMLEGMGTGKDASVYRASLLWPTIPFQTPRGRQLHDKAEAYLIAEYGRRKNGETDAF